MNATDPHASARSLSADIRRRTGLNAARCYQCGKCSAGCPMAVETTLRPHDIVRMVARDERERLLADDSVWFCLTCETCSARCPNQVDPARIVDAVREIAREDDPRHAPRPVRAFHQAFLGQIRRNGRVHEIGLTADYKLRSRDLLSDVTAAPGMFLRGKLPIRPARIEGTEDVRRIFARCLAGEDEP